MKTTDEGVTKYDQSDFTFILSLPRHEYSIVEKYRKMLNRISLIGAYENGIGFGNISQRKNYSYLHRTRRPQFIITGSQTGHLENLTGEHYTRVLDFDVEKFSVSAQGVIKASSETVTHAAIYQMNPYIQAVIHIHHERIWNEMIKDGYEFTSKWILYGTYEMAIAVRDCISSKTQGIFVMKGHKDGVIAYGPNMNNTMNIITGVYRKFVDHKFYNIQ